MEYTLKFIYINSILCGIEIEKIAILMFSSWFRKYIQKGTRYIFIHSS